MGGSLGLGEDSVLQVLRQSHEAGILREISGIFDGPALGYQTCLVAVQVAEERLEEAAAVISAHPGVSHNYRREHQFNLWFTLTVPPGGSIEWTVEHLTHLAGARQPLLLPSLRVFKIGVSLDMAGEREADARGDFGRRGAALQEPLSELEIELVRALQKPIKLVAEPFGEAARALGLSEAELFEGAERLKQQGRMRRYAAVLRHRRAGFSANGMSVWKVPRRRIDEVGDYMSSLLAVTHCYLRPTHPGWPYNIFAMVHGRAREECEAVVNSIAEETQIDEHDIIYSSTEFKKARLRYFNEELDDWEKEEPAKVLGPRTMGRSYVQ
jgi:siroheme decarboxylase